MNNSQEVMKTIKMIAKEQGKPLGKMLEDCGLSKNALSSMSSGYLPRTENLVKIADYLDISVDYLLGRKYKNSAPDEIRSAIINKVYSMPDEQCKKLLDFLESLFRE